MRFFAQRDIAAPIETVFAVVTDFDRFERQAIWRGAEVRRTAEPDASDAGRAWRAQLTFAGRPRTVDIVITRCTAPVGYAADTEMSGLSGAVAVDLVALSPAVTRLAVALDLRPRTLSARGLLQSMKLFKGKLSHRFETLVATYAREMESRAAPR